MNRFRALLIGFAATVGAGGIAAYNGVFDSPTPPAPVAGAVSTTAEPAKTGVPAAPADTAKTETPAAPAAEPAKPAEPATEVAKSDPAAPAAETPAAATDATVAADKPAVVAEMIAPSFDVLRVEPDGSVLVAGKASEGAQVEILSGADVLGAAKAEANGDFAITITNPLKPGDYQLVLRATGSDGKAATSIETATVSVPEQTNGQVLALVEEPGKPSRIITSPEKPVETAQVTAEPAKPADAAPADPAKPAEPAAPAAASDTAPAASAEVQVGGEVKAPAAAADAPAAMAESVNIEAVEVEDGKIFVAGSAKGVATVRIYANDVVLGDAKPGEGDRFLGEFTKELAVGDYIIRAEGLAADGATVISRASVPFQREADVAAVEPTKPAEAASSTQPDANAPAAASADASAPSEPAKPKAVIIRRGDTLWQISRRVYGRGVRYSTIYLANRDSINNPNRIFPGQVFKVPEKTPEGDAADPAEIEKRAAPAENSTQQ